MNSDTLFLDLVKEHFGFLSGEYGLSIVEEEPRMVVFQSEVCRVQIVEDRTQVFVDIGPFPPHMGKRSYYDLGHIMKYLDENSEPAYSFNPRGYDGDPYGSLTRQMTRLTKLLPRYCDALLRGDFSIEEGIEEFLAKK